MNIPNALFAVVDNQVITKHWWEFVFFSPLVAALVPTLLGSGIIYWLVNKSIERVKTINAAYLENIKSSLTESRDVTVHRSRIYFDAVTAYQKEATALQAIAIEAYKKLTTLANDAPTIPDNTRLVHRAAEALEVFSRFTVDNNEEFKLLTRRHAPDIVDSFDNLTSEFCYVVILLSTDPETRASSQRKDMVTEALGRMKEGLDQIERRISGLAPSAAKTP